MPFAATWMQLEILILSEVSQRQKWYDMTYMWNLKKKNELIYKTESDSYIDIEIKLIFTKEEEGEG